MTRWLRGLLPRMPGRLSPTARHGSPRRPADRLLRRLVTREEVAMAAQFLCSPAAAGISGHTLTVDGGAGIATSG